jgi:hypothetical protein
LIIEINFLNVFSDVESEYEIGFYLTITVLTLEGVAIIISYPFIDMVCAVLTKAEYKWMVGEKFTLLDSFQFFLEAINFIAGYF